ncbi:MAG: HAD-IB family phosphatase [Desulfatibacillaceae bacterium]
MSARTSADGSWKRMVFTDFDGTISSEETFAGMFEALVPDLAAQILPEIMARRTSIRQGVRQLLHAIPEKRYHEVVEYVDDKSIRPGFGELVDFLDRLGVPLVVVSGGLHDMVVRMLGPLTERCHAIHALETDFSGGFLDAHCAFESAEELVAKEKVLEHYSPQIAVCVGDGVTDVNLAIRARLVYARDRLCDYLDEQGLDYVRWNDFHDVRADLERRWKE